MSKGIFLGEKEKNIANRHEEFDDGVVEMKKKMICDGGRVAEMTGERTPGDANFLVIPFFLCF